MKKLKLPPVRHPHNSDELVLKAEKLSKDIMSNTKTHGEAIMVANMTRAMVEHNTYRSMSQITEFKNEAEKVLDKIMNKSKKEDKQDYIS